MKRFLCLMMMFIFSLTQAAERRDAHGQACYPTEKTYFLSDGVTPSICESTRGPAYDFLIYANDQLIWRGHLSNSQPEIAYKLRSDDPSIKMLSPQLIVMRDLKSDPTGHVVFFGETDIDSFNQYTDGNNSVSFPERTYVGKSIPVKSYLGALYVHVGLIEGSIMSDSDYSVVIIPQPL